MAHGKARMPINDSCTSESLQVSSDLSDGFVFRSASTTAYQPDHHDQVSHSVINFKSSSSSRGYNSNFIHCSESLLSFEKNEQSNYLKTGNDHKDDDGDEHYHDLHPHQSYQQWNDQAILLSGTCSSISDDPITRLSGDFHCFRTASNYSSMPNNASKENHADQEVCGTWLYSEPTVVGDSFLQESGTQESGFHKRPHMGESMQPLKKQCNTSAIKKPKPKSSPSKDPQSIAAKNRRERISERLKILQELVPNGCKVDLVTMLEKAISYVKFLQLQVKVLATDEFWPVQGGKAPDISQVKEAIDAILSSQRDTSTSSKL